MKNWIYEKKKKKKKEEEEEEKWKKGGNQSFPKIWVGRKRANKHLFQIQIFKFNFWNLKFWLPIHLGQPKHVLAHGNLK